jgi:hypothetical protein
MRFGIVGHHERQVQIRKTFRRKAGANNAARVPEHEGHGLAACLGGSEDEIAFVFTVLVVDDDDEFASRNGGDRVFHGVQTHACSLCECYE